MNPRVSGSVIAVRGLPLLRVHRTGELHSIREVYVDVIASFDGEPDLADADKLRDAVHALAASDTNDPEPLARNIARHIAQRYSAADVRVDLLVARWNRLDIGGRPRTSDFTRHAAELRTAHATAAAEHEAVHAGMRALQLLAADSAGGPPLLVDLDARWTYGWTDVPFDTQWQQVRRVIIEAYAERQSPAGAQLATALGAAVLEESPAVRSVELTLAIRSFDPVDVARFGLDSSPELVSAPRPGTAVYSCTVERSEMQDAR